MKRTKMIFIFLIMFSIIGCRGLQKGKNHRADHQELDKLVSLMAGKFSSELQAKSDTNYFHISLVMVPIWRERTDGKWLYVEQAAASKLNQPYRQRVYHLQQTSKNTFTSDIYIIKDALSLAGLQDDQNKMNQLTFDKIEKKEGCTVTLVHEGDIYKGGTDGIKCPSDLRSAKYTTTQIILKEGELRSWDQGFDASGKQVWGATKGGYIFIKQ